jgi:hypothetical protein
VWASTLTSQPLCSGGYAAASGLDPHLSQEPVWRRLYSTGSKRFRGGWLRIKATNDFWSSWKAMALSALPCARNVHAELAAHVRDAEAPTPFEWPLRDEADESLLDKDGRPIFDRLEPHDLRATAITLMRDAGFSKNQTAARVGHTDSGELIDRIYDRGDRRARAGVRAAIDSLAPQGIRAALAEEPPQPSASPVAALPARRTR